MWCSIFYDDDGVDDDNSYFEMAADDGNYCGMLVNDGDEWKQI